MVIRKRMRIAAAVLVMCTMAGCSLFPDGTRVVEKDAGESMQQIDYNSDHIKSTVSDVMCLRLMLMCTEQIKSSKVIRLIIQV